MRKYENIVKRLYDGLISFMKPQYTKQKQTLLDIKEGKFGVIVVHMCKPCIDQIIFEDLLIKAQRSVLESCAVRDIPVAVLDTHTHPTIKELEEKINLIPRHTYFPAGFKNEFEDLDEMLRRFSIENIYLMGIWTSSCVQKVAEEAIKRGYRISTSLDVIQDRGNTSASVMTEMYALDWFKKKGAFFENHSYLL